MLIIVYYGVNSKWHWKLWKEVKKLRVKKYWSEVLLFK